MAERQSAAEQYGKLYEQEKELEAQLSEVKAQRRNLEGKVITEFAELGGRKVKAGAYTVYLVPELRAWLNPDTPGGSRRQAHEALRQAGLGDLIEERVMDSALAKMVRELDEHGKELPRELEEWVTVHRALSVRARRASR